MGTVNELSNAVITVIRAGALFRAGFLFVSTIMSPDDAAANKKRILYVLAFYIISELAFQFKDVIMSYYS